tara:strand:+ start:10718 stop:11845 length:1128 start_codon:yes stop_codon:yes gene_type:complete
LTNHDRSPIKQQDRHQMNNFSRSGLAGLLAAVISVTAAQAETKSPRISGEVSFELQDDWTYKSDDRGNLNNHLFATVEPSVTFAIAPGWSVFAHAVLEPSGSPAKFENRMFEDTALYLADFYVEFAEGRFGAKAGKLNPGFGVAWDMAPGVYGSDLAEDYEISERIGVVGSWQVGAGRYGDHTVSGSTFFADTSIFSESALRSRGDLREGDGGLSNTESFRSFVVALNGENIPGAGKLGYHLSYMKQAAGAGNTADEKAFAAALYTSFGLGGGVAFNPLVEGVRIIDQGGTAGVDRTYLTVAGQLEWQNWNLAASVTERETNNVTTANDTDTHMQISAGYTFDFGLSIDVGWKISEDAGTETRTLGAVAAYTVTF